MKHKWGHINGVSPWICAFFGVAYIDIGHAFWVIVHGNMLDFFQVFFIAFSWSALKSASAGVIFPDSVGAVALA